MDITPFPTPNGVLISNSWINFLKGIEDNAREICGIPSLLRAEDKNNAIIESATRAINKIVLSVNLRKIQDQVDMSNILSGKVEIDEHLLSYLQKLKAGKA